MLVAASESCDLADCLPVALGWVGKFGVADGRAVTAHVDGVHDGESATNSKGEAEEESDDGGPVKVHYRWSVSRVSRTGSKGIEARLVSARITDLAETFLIRTIIGPFESIIVPFDLKQISFGWVSHPI